MWLAVGIAVVSAIGSVVFAIFSWGAKREISRRDKKLEEMEKNLQTLQRDYDQHQLACANNYMSTNMYDRLEKARAGQVDAWLKTNENLEKYLGQALDTMRKMKTSRE